MFKSICKGIKWFFTPPKEDAPRISRKHGISHIKANDSGHVIRVIEKPKAPDIAEMYTRISQAAQQDGKRERDAIEHAKADVWKPYRIEEQHKEYILQVCGFTKTHMAKGEKVYDPRLLQVINLAMNMYSIQASDEMLKILDSVNKD